jgi:Ni/Co efflux regulator RcnB
MKRIILAVAISFVALPSVSASPAPTGANDTIQLAQLQLVQRDFDRDFRRGRDRDWDSRRRRDRDWDWDRRRGPRYDFIPGGRYREAPRGWRRYSSRPRNWRNLNCVLVGPFWFCP